MTFGFAFVDIAGAIGPADRRVGTVSRPRDRVWELRRTLAPLVIYTMDPYRWRVEYKAGAPTIPMTRAHVDAAKAKLAPNVLRFWASVVLLTDVYDWDEEEADGIAEELHRLAWQNRSDAQEAR